MASTLDRREGGPHSNRNLWIILGTVLGVLVAAFIIGGIWICCTRLQRRGLLPTRTVTPLDDAEFESWRRPSMHNNTNSNRNRYTVMPRTRTTSADDTTAAYHHGSMLEKQDQQQRPWTAPSHSHIPPRSRRESGTRPSSIQDRPPTPYSARGRPDSQDLASPTHITYPKRAHVHYPSVSETSEFDFEFEKFDAGTTSQPEDTNRLHQSSSDFRKI